MSYSPYTSGSDSEYDTGSGSGTGSESESEYEDARIRREQDPRYAILRRPDANKTITTDFGDAPGAPWDPTTNITSLKDYTYTAPPKTTKTSLFSMKSTNRDKKVFPTPFNFQLKLPRVYKNVTKFQLVQLSFPNSSNGVTGVNLFVSSLVQDMLENGVPSSCISTCINVAACSPATNAVAFMEQGRINAFGQPLLTTVSMPEGIYNDAQIADELTFQANSTPPLNLITYSEFKDAFINTRDPSVLFNEPGDTFYSKTGVRINRPTKSAIMNTYYSQHHINILPVITEQVAFVAYYFPILKELIATGMAKPFLQGVGNYDELVERVTGIFEGLDSVYYYQVCLQFEATLANFRRHLTFEYHSINSYAWKYNDKESRFTTIHNQLHTSIQRDITASYQTILNRELALASLNANSFTTLQTSAIHYSAIYKHLETNLSSVLGRYALVNDYQYQGGCDHITRESTFTCEGLAQDTDFNTMFSYKSSIGGIYGNYGGTIMHFRNFMDYHSTLSTYYTIVQSTTSTINQLHQTIAMNHHMYVSTKYNNVLPPKIIETRGYMTNQAVPVAFITSQRAYVPGILPMDLDAAVTPVPTTVVPDTVVENTVVYPDDNATAIGPDGLSYDTLSNNVGIMTLPTFTTYTTTDCSAICCTYINRLLTKWYSCLPVNSVIGTLTYRLGLTNMSPAKFNLISTIMNYTSSNKLNFLMQINDEQGFNNMDLSMDENYSIHNDTNSQVKFVAAKILMANIGDESISQTLIQNPSIFENTLGKLDRLNIKIYYDDPAITPAWLFLPFQYDATEWNATFQIDEEVGFINQDDGWPSVPTLPVPQNPNDTPYLYYTKKAEK